jgi:hypothetical protein
LRSRELQIDRTWERRGALWAPRYAPRAPQYRHGFDGPRRVPPSVGGGGLTVINAEAFDVGGTSLTAKTYSPSWSLTAGSALLFLGRTETGWTATSDGTNSWSHSVNYTGSGQELHAWLAANNALTGSPTFTLTAGANYTLFGGVFVEIGGASTTTPYETSATTTNGYGTDRYCGSLTIAGSALVFGWLIDSNTGLDDATYGLTPDAGYTRVAYIGSCVNIGIIYKLQTAGTYNPLTIRFLGNRPFVL